MKNDRYIVIAVVLVALAAAAGMNGGTQAVEVGAGVTIEASGGPNSQYVTVDDTGNISIDLSDSNKDVAGAGVNDNAVVRFGNVLLINNTNDRRASVYLSDETDAIEFVESGQGVGGTGSSIEGQDNEVVLDGGEQLTVGFAVDTNQIDDIETTFTLVVRVTESAEEPPTTTPTTTEPPTTTQTERPTTTQTGPQTPTTTPTPTEPPTTTQTDPQTTTTTPTPTEPPTTTTTPTTTEPPTTTTTPTTTEPQTPTTTPTTTEPQTQTGTPTEPDGLDPVIGLVIAIIVVVAAAIGALLYWPRVSGSE